MSVPAGDYDELGFLADNAAEAGLAWSGPPRVERRSVAVSDGRSISALAWGDEPEVVLLHGGAQNAHTWDTVALALGRPLVAVDLPGHGHSSWRDDHDYRPSTAAPDVAAAIAALAPGLRLLVGMSLGGLTALAVAALRPELAPRLVLVDITPGVTGDKAADIIAFVAGPESFESFDAILERTVAFNPTRSESSLRRGILHNAREEADGSWSWRYDRLRAESVIDAGDELEDLWEAVGGLAEPPTVIRGDRSPVVTDDDIAELRRRQPDATVLTVIDAGHSIQGDQPVVLAHHLLAMLEG